MARTIKALKQKQDDCNCGKRVVKTKRKKIVYKKRIKRTR